MMARLFLILVILAVGLSASASAQRTGTRIGRDATSKDGAAAMEILANCAVDRRPDLVRQWLNMLPGSAEEEKLLTRWSTDLGACMDSDRLVLDGMALRFEPIVMRLPVARILAVRLLRNSETITPPPPSGLWFTASLATLTKGAEVDRDALGLQDFGHCIAQNEWTGTRELLLSQPSSPEQTAAVKKLVPAIGPCLTDGVQISLTPANLRSILAEPVYHLLAPSPVEAVTSKR